MKSSNFRFLLGLVAVALTGAHLVRADVQLVFSDRNDGEFVKVAKLRGEPLRFRLSRCKSDQGCTVFGRNTGYTVEEIRTRAFSIYDRRSKRPLTNVETRQVDTLMDLLDGIERPVIRWETRAYSHSVKGSVDSFVKTIEDSMKGSES